ncbi:LacI family DNA-binding transcriptional regulator [Pelagicoccus mobilis]|uniref:LacI family DNA-binding transcriptional regulator n=1 Tax=Pelagicoccus mobilis TaxID=415221 RepID=A0A934VP64_9BACT|nr:LacI family DNA-binding transcriptional regulator [Pelagicoccus mobilis]MBK1875495.1 LacI family DNA-binding transcriptional regulator [Pelagicoccus mobilis]
MEKGFVIGLKNGQQSRSMATIYEVAKEAGVSPKTAARILAGSSSRPKNKELVMAAAKKLGYVRNQQAANLRSGKSGLIGLIIPSITSPFYPWFFQTIHDTALAKGYQVLLSSVSGGHSEVVKALQMMEANRVEGLLFNMSEWDDKESLEILNRFVERKQPVIVGGTNLGKIQADEIVIKNIEAIEKATSYLIKTGHKKIAFISGPQAALGNRERLEGYRNAMDKAKLMVKDGWVCEGTGEFVEGLDLAKTLLRMSDRPTAIVCATDLIAIGAMKAAQEMGLSVPNDLAVTGFDDIPWAKLSAPSLTTLRQPQNRIARETVNLLIERINSKDISNPRRLVFEPDLIIRESA